MNANFLKFILRGLFTALFFFAALSACTKKQAATNQMPLTPEQLVEKGQQVFTVNCQSCHGADAKKDGSIGPAIWGSSLELITARVLHVEYPTGYAAKRSTKLMVPLPHLEADLPAIHAFLNK